MTHRDQTEYDEAMVRRNKVRIEVIEGFRKAVLEDPSRLADVRQLRMELRASARRSANPPNMYPVRSSLVIIVEPQAALF